MVAASIQVFASALQETLAPADCISASSQGVLMQAIDAIARFLGAFWLLSASSTGIGRGVSAFYC